MGAKTPTDDGGQHGSCVASKAAGFYNGVSKTSQLTMMKILWSFPAIDWAFDKIWEDITDKGRQGRSVVVLPAAWTNTPDRTQDSLKIERTMRDLFDINTVIVVPSGNYAKGTSRQDVDTFPSLWEDENFPLIVVGAVDQDGNYATFSQRGRHVTTWAPGVSISCSGDHSPGTSYGTGTSFSAPMVSHVPPRINEGAR